jgi:hypothetical protein
LLALSVKRRTKVLIALGVLLAIGGIAAWQRDSILRAYVSYSVRTVTTALPHSDRVEVFHLSGTAFARDEADRPKPGEGFPIRAYGSAEAKILGRTTLNGTDAEALAAMWRAQTFDWGLQALCHSPAYGLRFYSGNKLTFETSLCFHCSNFYVTDLLGSGWWGFDSKSPTAQELLRRIQEIFPDSIPKPK